MDEKGYDEHAKNLQNHLQRIKEFMSKKEKNPNTPTAVMSKLNKLYKCTEKKSLSIEIIMKVEKAIEELKYKGSEKKKLSTQRENEKGDSSNSRSNSQYGRSRSHRNYRKATRDTSRSRSGSKSDWDETNDDCGFRYDKDKDKEKKKPTQDRGAWDESEEESPFDLFANETLSELNDHASVSTTMKAPRLSFETKSYNERLDHRKFERKEVGSYGYKERSPRRRRSRSKSRSRSTRYRTNAPDRSGYNNSDRNRNENKGDHSFNANKSPEKSKTPESVERTLDDCRLDFKNDTYAPSPRYLPLRLSADRSFRNNKKRGTFNARDSRSRSRSPEKDNCRLDFKNDTYAPSPRYLPLPQGDANARYSRSPSRDDCRLDFKNDTYAPSPRYLPIRNKNGSGSKNNEETETSKSSNARYNRTVSPIRTEDDCRLDFKNDRYAPSPRYLPLHRQDDRSSRKQKNTFNDRGSRSRTPDDRRNDGGLPLQRQNDRRSRKQQEKTFNDRDSPSRTPIERRNNDSSRNYQKTKQIRTVNDRDSRSRSRSRTRDKDNYRYTPSPRNMPLSRQTEHGSEQRKKTDKLNTFNPRNSRSVSPHKDDSRLDLGNNTDASSPSYSPLKDDRSSNNFKEKEKGKSLNVQETRPHSPIERTDDDNRLNYTNSSYTPPPRDSSLSRQDNRHPDDDSRNKNTAPSSTLTSDEFNIESDVPTIDLTSSPTNEDEVFQQQSLTKRRISFCIDEDIIKQIVDQSEIASPKVLGSTLAFDTESVKRALATAMNQKLTSTSNVEDTSNTAKNIQPKDPRLMRTQEPRGYALEVQQPLVQQPVVPEPLVQQPLIQQPLIEKPVVQQPLVQHPLVPQPLVQQTLIQKPLIEKPIVQQPVVQQPVVQQPVVQQPVVQQPVVQQPVVQQPRLQDPRVQKTPVQELNVQELRLVLQEEQEDCLKMQQFTVPSCIPYSKPIRDYIRSPYPKPRLQSASPHQPAQLPTLKLNGPPAPKSGLEDHSYKPPTVDGQKIKQQNSNAESQDLSPNIEPIVIPTKNVERMTYGEYRRWREANAFKWVNKSPLTTAKLPYADSMKTSNPINNSTLVPKVSTKTPSHEIPKKPNPTIKEKEGSNVIHIIDDDWDTTLTSLNTQSKGSESKNLVKGRENEKKNIKNSGESQMCSKTKNTSQSNENITKRSMDRRESRTDSKLMKKSSQPNQNIKPSSGLSLPRIGAKSTTKTSQANESFTKSSSISSESRKGLRNTMNVSQANESTTKQSSSSSESRTSSKTMKEGPQVKADVKKRSPTVQNDDEGSSSSVDKSITDDSITALKELMEPNKLLALVGLMGQLSDDNTFTKVKEILEDCMKEKNTVISNQKDSRNVETNMLKATKKKCRSELENLFDNTAFIRNGAINGNGRRSQNNNATATTIKKATVERNIQTKMGFKDRITNNRTTQTTKARSISPVSNHDTYDFQPEPVRIRRERSKSTQFQEPKAAKKGSNDMTRSTIIAKRKSPSENNKYDEPLAKRAMQLQVLDEYNKKTKQQNDELKQASVVLKKITKNNNPECHSLVKIVDCQLCDQPVGLSIVSHYVNHHPLSEVLTSRLAPAAGTLFRSSGEVNPCKIVRRPESSSYELKQFCFFCNTYKCFIKSIWIDHLTRHSGYYQYKCVDCSRKFCVKNLQHACKKKNNLEKIPQPQFQKQKIIAYVCDLCNFVRFHKSEILKHLNCEHDKSATKTYTHGVFLCFPKRKLKNEVNDLEIDQESYDSESEEEEAEEEEEVEEEETEDDTDLEDEESSEESSEKSSDGKSEEVEEECESEIDESEEVEGEEEESEIESEINLDNLDEKENAVEAECNEYEKKIEQEYEKEIMQNLEKELTDEMAQDFEKDLREYEEQLDDGEFHVPELNIKDATDEDLIVGCEVEVIDGGEIELIKDCDIELAEFCEIELTEDNESEWTQEFNKELREYDEKLGNGRCDQNEVDLEAENDCEPTKNCEQELTEKLEKKLTDELIIEELTEDLQGKLDDYEEQPGNEGCETKENNIETSIDVIHLDDSDESCGKSTN